MDFIDLGTGSFWLAVGQIILIDILLGGDNAVVIALACRRLSVNQRKQGIFWGVVGAIALRIFLIFFALQLLQIPFLKIAGGFLLFWIGAQLLKQGGDDQHEVAGSSTLLGAIKTIIIADAVMSIDNVIAVAGAARGNMALVIFGIVVSIPIIVWGSQLVIKLMDRFPFVITLGAGLLGWIGGEMIVADQILNPFISQMHSVTKYLAATLGAVFVVLLGRTLKRK